MSADFRAQLNQAYEKKVLDKVDKTVRGTALIVFGEIVKNTPVDTGRARANWHIDINNVDVSLVEPDHMEDTSVVARYKMGDTIFISNNLPYIRPLDEGHSKQAPAGFVDAAIQVGKMKGAEL